MISLHRFTLCVLVIFVCVPIMSVSARVHATSTIVDSQHDALYEVFQPHEGLLQPPYNSSAVTLSWWLWSDDTDSNWPDDDGKTRADSLDIERDEDLMNNGTIRVNGQPSLEHVNQKIVDVTGDISIVQLEEGESVIFDISITPKENLSDDTLMYIILSRDSAYDHHGRYVENLIMEFKPEIGFSNLRGNVTMNQYVLEPSHLEAAGVDFELQPHGWSYTIAFMGKGENTSKPNLLALYHGPLPTSSTMLDLSDTFLPLIVIISASAIFYGVVQHSKQREELIPTLNAHWIDNEARGIEVVIQNGKEKTNILSWEVIMPWALSSRPPKLQLRPDETKSIELKFKQSCTAPCQIMIRLEIESLGVWKQHLILHTQDDDQASSSKS